MNERQIDRIVGEMPDFMLRLELREIAKKYLSPEKWTHLEGLDADGQKMFEAMVKAGLVQQGEAVPDGGGEALVVYRLKA